MFHKAIDLKYRKGTVLEVTFQDGLVKQYDVAVLFNKHPYLIELKNRNTFLSGRLMGYYGIIWNDEIDLETETIYENGITVAHKKPAPNIEIGDSVAAARAKSGISQKQLSDLTGIDQSDISKIERGTANPSVATLRRIAEALNAELIVKIA